MVALGQHYGDLDGHGAIIGVMHGGGGTPLSAVRPMLGWCIVTLASARLKASVQFPLLRGTYQKETLARGATIPILRVDPV